MGTHNRGGRQHPRVDEGKERRILALLDGKEILAPSPPTAWQPRPGQVKLHISNLSYDVVEDDLRDLFAPCGDIIECHLFKDFDTGKSRGFACLRMRDQAGGDKALAMNGYEWAGRTLQIKQWGRE